MRVCGDDKLNEIFGGNELTAGDAVQKWADERFPADFKKKRDFIARARFGFEDDAVDSK